MILFLKGSANMCVKHNAIKLAFLIAISFLLFAKLSYADVIWGNRNFSALEGNALTKAKDGLISCEYIEDPAMFDTSDIDYVAVIDGTVVFCFNEWADTKKQGIALYDLTGTFIEGYKLRFDRHNGVYGITYSDGSLLYYKSAYSCIYKLSKNAIEYYYVPGNNVAYLHSSMSDLRYKVDYNAYFADITDQSGFTQRIVDHSSRINEREEQLTEYKQNFRFVVFFLFILVLVFLVSTIIKLLKAIRDEKDGATLIKSNEKE